MGAGDPITAETEENSRNNILRSKQNTRKGPPNIFRSLEVAKKISLMYWRPNNSMKGKSYVFRDCKKKVRCASCISSGNC